VVPKDKIAELVEVFAKQNCLGQIFVHDALKFIVPLTRHIKSLRSLGDGPIVIGINGSQGSGKSTIAALLVDLLSSCFHYQALAISIDDFYISSQARGELAATVHPLLQTRGVPGTHDLKLALDTIQRLTQSACQVTLPAFDKATDEPRSRCDLHQFGAPCDILILEGWCVGIAPQCSSALAIPVNSLEALEDPQAIWRMWVNKALTRYQQLFGLLDCLVMLKAPDFKCVASWRLEQEERLDSSLTDDADRSAIMDKSQIERFVQHYQRLTEHALATLENNADVVFNLNASRKIVSSTLKAKTGGL
jgi:D-glycerate 3-kinase